MTVSNSVTLIGNLGNDFEVKNFGNGRTLAKSSLATSERFKTKDGESVQRTEWHALEVWGKKAEILAKYTQKGSKIAVHGKIAYNVYEDDQGIRRKSTNIVVDEFKFLDKKQEPVAAF